MRTKKCPRKIYRYAAGALALICAFAFGIPASMAAGKNETVYAKLKSDGSVEQIFIVNQLMSSYTDYGVYSDIRNLSTLTSPVIEGDKISFSDEAVEGGLYYQGSVEGELPIKTAILWYLDGRAVSADELGGATGRLKLAISTASNPLCDERVRDGLTTQISVPLSLKKASNILAEGATMVVAGSTATISYVVMPDEAGTLIIEADVRDFEMDTISITLIRTQMSLGGFSEDIDELESGIDDMADGAQQMADGMSELKSGVRSLSGGVKDLSGGLDELASQGQKLAENMGLYGQGLGEYFSGLQSLKTASSKIRNGLNELKDNGAAVSAGVAGIHNGLENIAGGSGELKALAQMLFSSEDEAVRALATGTLELIGAVGAVSGHAGAAASGVEGFVSGVNKLAEEYTAFDEGMEALSGAEVGQGFDALLDGTKKYVDGVSQSADGLRSINKHLNKLPPSLQELIDAQIEFKDGIAEAGDGIAKAKESFSSDEKGAVSFASPDKNTAASVQYILTAPSISKPKIEKELSEQQHEKTFFERFADLFR